MDRRAQCLGGISTKDRVAEEECMPGLVALDRYFGVTLTKGREVEVGCAMDQAVPGQFSLVTLIRDPVAEVGCP